MSNNDIFRKELNELESSLIFDDASWAWSYDVDLAQYCIALLLEGILWKTVIDWCAIDDLQYPEGAAKFAVTNLYSAAKGEVS